MTLLGVVIEGKFRMEIGRDKDISIEFEPKEYPPEFFEIVKKKDYKINGELWIITSGKAHIKDLRIEGDLK